MENLKKKINKDTQFPNQFLDSLEFILTKKHVLFFHLIVQLSTIIISYKEIIQNF